MPRVIAIDGPSASGKSTVARRVAGELGWVYVDSGSLYRGITWHALRTGTDVGSVDAMKRMVDSMNISFRLVDKAMRFMIGGVDPDMELRSQEVAGSVSLVAATPFVRLQVNVWLKDMIKFGDLVVEGRDIGSVVFPDAFAKFYLDASPEERARRRMVDFSKTGREVALETVKGSLQKRDSVDSTRATAPLTVAKGAIVLDTTTMTLDEVVQDILSRVKNAR